MSDDPTPELRALAAQLFAAGRRERPGPALGRRLMLLEPPRHRNSSAPQAVATAREAAAAIVRQRQSRWRGFVWLAAALLSGGISAGFALRRELSSVPISAERGGSTSSLERATSVAPPAPMPLALPADVEAERPGVRALEAARRAGGSTGEARVHRAPRPARGGEPTARSPGMKRSTSRRSSRDEAEPAAAPPTATLAGPKSKVADAPASDSGSGAAPRPLTLIEELELLQRARHHLRAREAARALELLDRYARERHGVGLDAEATLLRIEAYAALGRQREASDLASRFVRENPNSALGDRAKTFIRSTPSQTSAP